LDVSQEAKMLKNKLSSRANVFNLEANFTASLGRIQYKT